MDEEFEYVMDEDEIHFLTQVTKWMMIMIVCRYSQYNL